MTAHIFRVLIPTKTLGTSVEFWSRVLEQPGELVSPGRHYFQVGETVLAVYDPEADGDGVGQGWRFHENQYVYFSVPDLEGVLGRVRDAGGEIQEEIAAMPWGERLFYALDPGGVPVCFVDEETVFRG